MIDARVEDLLSEVGLKPSSGAHATIVGRDPILGYRFPVGEAAAVALAACGVAVSDLWELRGGRPQRARVDVRRAAARPAQEPQQARGTLPERSWAPPTHRASRPTLPCAGRGVS